MTETLHAARMRKIAYKSLWTALDLAAAKCRPQLDVLHLRDSGFGPDFPEGVYRLNGGAYVEPTSGYVITAAGQLSELSMRPNRWKQCVPWRVDLPSPAEFLAARKPSAANVIRYPVVISLRHLWDWNYYHFFSDVLARLRLLADVGIAQDVPLVLGKYAGEMPFVQEILNCGALKNRPWVNPETRFVYADSVIFCHTQQDRKHGLGYIAQQMAVPAANPRSVDRVFLTRPPSATRKVANVDELAPVLAKYGFRALDSSTMSISDQMREFAGMRYLVAVHGAGITNIMFRQGAPMSMIEIQPHNYATADFMQIAESYGYGWSLLKGEAAHAGNSQHVDFRVSRDALDEKIAEMLAAA
jgi:hypothetical protein